ncbi:MAG: dihydropteroate synthase [Bacteroidales bacterium]|nr:dihydropteroate synthase [Bacteroidales bacterium]
MVKQMAIVNLTPDSFYEPSRVWSNKPDAAMARIHQFLADGADIIDLGAVSTRPGAADVPLEEEWRRLEDVLAALSALRARRLPPGEAKTWEKPPLGGTSARSAATSAAKLPLFSIDTTSAEIVRRAYKVIGEFIVNDISAGEDDPEMLPTVAELGLPYIAMHKRGNPRSMDSLADYPDGIMAELLRYFKAFSAKAEELGINDWILDPGLGFAKNIEQNWEILENLDDLKVFGRPILIGAADKRFTHGDTAAAHELALKHGADILRVHELLPIGR